MSVPLVPRSKRQQWGTKMRTACAAAMASQRRSVTHTVNHSVVAAGKARPSTGAIAGAVVGSPWSSDEWAKQVATHIEPVAQSIASDAIASAKASLPANLTMGMPESGADIASNLVDAALTTGNGIGERLNANAGTSGTVAEADDEMSAVFDTADSILDNVVGSMAERASSIATNDVTSFLSSAFGNTYSGAEKVWVSMDDENVRPDHEEVSGQSVPLNGTFNVGGEDMVGPGDPTASDDQTLGCRCDLETDGVLPEGTDAPDDYATVDQGGEDA